MRKFEKSHPWISFSVSFKDAPAQLWLLLGEAASKIEHIAGVPLRPSVANELHRIYLAKGAFATTAIEGNTLSEEQARKQLDGTLKLPKSQQYLAQEIQNIINACTSITESAPETQYALTSEAIAKFNKSVLENLPADPEIKPGKFRTKEVVVGNAYRGAPAEDCPYLVKELCEWLAGDDFKAPKDLETVYAIIKAIIAHLYLVWIHPFDDGNGRTSRLIEFYILVHANVPSPAAHLLSNHYNLTRAEYYRQLRAASESGGNILPFVKYAVEGLVDGLKGQLAGIKLQQWDVTWRNYVHEMFRDKTKKIEKRRRDLLLALSEDATPIKELFELTPRLARLYAKKSMRTLLRDLEELEKLELVLIKAGKVRACKETILAFLPLRKSF
jgi:Fic family protein